MATATPDLPLPSQPKPVLISPIHRGMARLSWLRLRSFWSMAPLDLFSYREQIARQLRTQYVAGINYIAA